LIEDNEFLLVEFYAPWCGHCKQLEPEYEAAAEKLKSEGSKVKLVKVDATVEERLAKEHDIKGFPTIIFFKNGEKMEYDGPRQAEGITSWVKKRSGPPSETLKSDEISSFLSKGSSVVGVFKDEESKLYKAFIKTAKEIDDFNFGHSFDPNTEEYVTLTNSEKNEIKFDKSVISKKGIKDWIINEGYPILVELDQHVWERSNKNKISLFVAFIDKTQEDQKEMFKEVGKKFKGKVLSSFMDSEQNVELAKRWGASGTKFPTVVLVNYITENPKLYIWNEETEKDFSMEAITSFIEKSLDGTYQNYQKSEPIPEKNDEPVKVLVGKTFKDIVYDETKDVLVEFYAPWCGHCQKLVPIYESLAKKLSHVPSIVIAKMDATANAFPEDISVSGFPTIYFFRRDDKTPIMYEGNRELDDLLKFVTDNASSIQKKEEKSDL